MNTQAQYKTIDDYIALFPEQTATILREIKNIVKEEVPDAKEKISYQMPTFTLNSRNLVHFAAWKEHIGLYPTPSGIVAFQKELSQYEVAKGSIRFSLNNPIPYDLIRKIVAFRASENRQKFEKH